MKPNKFINCSFFIVFFCFISSCNFAPKYQAPDVGSPEKFRSAVSEGKSLANTQWWDLFNDPILQKLIEEALEKNIDLQIAISKIAQARAELGISTGDFGEGDGVQSPNVPDQYINSRPETASREE